MFKRTNTRLLETLSPDSEVLAWIQKDFHTMLRSRQKEGKEPPKITCFYEELPIHGIGEVTRILPRPELDGRIVPSQLTHSVDRSDALGHPAFVQFHRYSQEPHGHGQVC
jgi:hypothetical protein